ncbi:MAG: transcription elongation factor GreA [Firmicutes bacterium]|uniref:Transcription elongation factor GreA n=1 Tax=Candidatus Scybalomonas excrementavium TaxID=2840943 RepID=A0A9D9N7L1_9FIRM|nr:transcription elongation factor GreA [Candidatus Scybalomonas excrementavium]
MYNQLTKSDIQKMEEEIEHRKCVVRKQLLEHVKEARAQGDLSENFEYYAAKKEKNRNESRIRYLERMIKTAKIVSEESKEDEVGLNNTVILYFEEDKEVETYKVVTTMREDILNNKISKESPLGRAIFGHKVNDRVFVKVNDQYGYYVVIQEIQKTGEEEGDTIRSF